MIQDNSNAATIEAQTRYGEIMVFVHDRIASRSLVLYGEWAQNELDILARFIRPGAIVVDGGGYVGSHSLAFSRFVGDSGVVHTFEPNPVSCAVLSDNLRRNARANVILHPIGLAASVVDLKTDALDVAEAGNFGGASFHEHRQAGESVPSYQQGHFVPLDDILPHADFLKLDLEGMETEALNGANRILREDRPHVFAECNSIASGVALLAAMAPRGYHAFGCLVDAFNPGNFLGVADNIFGEAMEFGLLFIHEARLAEVAAEVEACGLLEAADADALAAYLFRKPQYPHEVLRKLPQWRALGLQRRADEIDEGPGALEQARSLAISRQQQCDLLQAALDETQALAIERQQQCDKIQEALDQTQALARSRHEELEKERAIAFERLRRIDELRVALSDVQALAAERASRR